MRKYISLLTCFSLFIILSACERNSISLEEEAATLAKECGLMNISTHKQILSVEKVENEVVLLKQAKKWHLKNDVKSYVHRYKLSDSSIGTTLLTCAFKDMLFADSTYAEVSGYWVTPDLRPYGAVDGVEPYIFLLTDLKIVDKPAN